MTDNTSNPEEAKDGALRRPERTSENLSKGTPEVNNANLRAAQKANPNKMDTVSPDGKSRFSLTDDGAKEKQSRAAQEKAYREAGLGDPNKAIGKANESKIDPVKIAEHASKALNKILESGMTAAGEGAKVWNGAHKGMHEVVDESVQSVAVAKDYYSSAFQGKVNLGADIKEFAGAISKGLSQRLGTAQDYYFRQVPKGETNLVKDLGTAGKAASDHWNSMDSEQKGHFIGKEVVPLIVPGAVGIVAKEVQGANLVAKTGEAITAFSSSEKLAALEQKMAHFQEHVQRISNLAKPLEPAYVAVSDGAVRRPNLPEQGKKAENFLAMGKAEDGENVPRRSGDGGRERAHLPEKVAPSERFISELKEAQETFSKSERAFLEKHEIQIKPVRRLEEIKPGIDKRTAGIYHPGEKTIYIPEEVWSKGEWRPNNDVKFELKHEFGHGLNAKSDPLGQWISESKEFRGAFREDIKHIPAEKLGDLQLNFDRIERMRDEVFADMYGHASGLESNNPRSIQMKALFKNCLEYVKKQRLE